MYYNDHNYGYLCGSYKRISNDKDLYERTSCTLSFFQFWRIRVFIRYRGDVQLEMKDNSGRSIVRQMYFIEQIRRGNVLWHFIHDNNKVKYLLFDSVVLQFVDRFHFTDYSPHRPTCGSVRPRSQV